MTEDELTIPDVIADEWKNFTSIYSNASDDENEAQNYSLCDSHYYTESEFVDLMISRKFKNHQNLTILSLNMQIY